ncbi:unnamed protein product, partial [Prorocentrum cordatum]
PPGVSNAPPPPSAARPRGRELGSARPARPGQGAMSAMVLRIALAALAAARLAAAVPGGVEKIVCEVLSQRSLERGAANATCAEVQELAEKYPGVITPYQDCAERFEHFWEKAAAACPKHRRHFDLPADIPEDIKKELCDVASQKDVEEKAIKYVCEKVKDEVNPVECNLVLKAAWAHALEDCSPNKTAPSPADIEKLICEYASQQPIEDKAVEEICEVVTAKFPSVPDCKGMVEAAWAKALAMCPKQQAMLPSPADIEKLICEYASQQPIEDKAVEEICEVVTAKFPSVPDCKGMVEAAWAKALAMCPKQQAMLPSPADIEKLICEYASQQPIEDKAVEEICEVVTAKFPSVPDCKGMVEAAWDKALAMCPKQQAMLPSPADIEKLICEYASQQPIEDKAVEEICEVVTAKFPSVPDCKGMVEAAWAKALAMCPKQQAMLPSPADIEKLICEYASQQPIEDKAVEEICEVVTAKFPSVPDCKGMVEAAWDKALAMCPKQQAMLPSPADIEKLICEYASQQPIEDKAVEEICEVVTAKFPSVPDCKGMVEAAWDKALAMCPKEQLMAPSPADIEKLICEFASKKQIEDKAVEEVCQAIADKFPSIKFDPDCKTVMEFGGGGGHVPQAEPRDAHVRLRRSPAKPCDAVASSRVGGPRAGSGEGSPRREGRRCTTSRGRPPGGRPRSAPLLGRLARRLRAGVHTQPLGERALQRPVRCSDGLQGSEDDGLEEEGAHSRW